MNENLIYLTQTDTTVGFLSNDNIKLAKIKNRPTTKKTLHVVDSFKTLKIHTRIPKNKRKLIRNARNITFIYPNGESFRVIDKNCKHHKFIKKFKTLYSTSANETGKKFNLDFALKTCDIQVVSQYKYKENNSSSIIKINNNKSIKIR